MLLFISVISLIILFLVNLIAERKDFSGRFSWFDKVTHSLGGFFVAMFWSGLTQFLLLIISLTLLVGAAWEIGRYFFGTYKFKRLGAKKYMINTRDTVEDLFFDFIGAIVWVFILWAFNIYLI